MRSGTRSAIRPSGSTAVWSVFTSSSSRAIDGASGSSDWLSAATFLSSRPIESRSFPRTSVSSVIVSGDLRAAPDAIRLSRATLRTIKQNLAWAFGYNVAALPLAAAGLLNPLLAGLAMALSSVSVVANALRLRRFRSSH